MQLRRSERDWYILVLSTTPALSGTWQASFDAGATWINATVTQSETGWVSGGKPIKDTAGNLVTTAQAWLLAGPDFDAAAMGMDPADTAATVTGEVVPLLRIADNPVLDVEQGARIRLIT